MSKLKITQQTKDDEDDKKIQKTTYEKEDNGFVVGIDMKNHKELSEMSKLVEKREAKILGRYIMCICYFWSKNKLMS